MGTDGKWAGVLDPAAFARKYKRFVIIIPPGLDRPVCTFGDKHHAVGMIWFTGGKHDDALDWKRSEGFNEKSAKTKFPAMLKDIQTKQNDSAGDGLRGGAGLLELSPHDAMMLSDDARIEDWLWHRGSPVSARAILHDITHPLARCYSEGRNIDIPVRGEQRRIALVLRELVPGEEV